MKEIKLTRGKFALVDDESFDEISKFKWHYHARGYASRTFINENRKHVTWLMHWSIIGRPPDRTFNVDHIDGNRLNNCKSNLRMVTISQNAMNKGILPGNRSGYKGIYFHKKHKKWYATITVRKVVKRLGVFSTPQEAHEAYCEACKIYHGEFANFG